MLIWNRKKQELFEETVPAGVFLAAVYHPAVYFWLGRFLYCRALVSRFIGWLSRTGWSRRKIGKFIHDYQIDMDECFDDESDFRTFNDFFIRRLNPDSRTWDSSDDLLACPADCRALFFSSAPFEHRLSIKGIDFSISDLLSLDEDHEGEFSGGPVMIARLSPVDCHRFYFPADGQVVSWQALPGRYDSVHPLALCRRQGILAANSRHVTLLNLDNFGTAAMVEVGAFAVADIVQTHRESRFAKMDEKGYFNLGGSTIVLVFKPGSLGWDRDLLENSARGVETRLLFGERIGRRVDKIGGTEKQQHRMEVFADDE